MLCPRITPEPAHRRLVFLWVENFFKEEFPCEASECRQKRLRLSTPSDPGLSSGYSALMTSSQPDCEPQNCRAPLTRELLTWWSSCWESQLHTWCHPPSSPIRHLWTSRRLLYSHFISSDYCAAEQLTALRRKVIPVHRSEIRS